MPTTPPTEQEYEASLDAILAEDDAETPDAPAAAPSPDSPAPADADPADPEPEAGQPRDAHGRFAPKSQTDAPTAENAAAPAPPTPDAATPPSAPPATPPVPPQPFVVRAAGKEHTIDWLQPGPDGAVVVPADRLAEFRQLASEALTARTVGREERIRSAQTIKALQSQVSQQTAEQQTAQQLVQALATLPEDQAWVALSEFRAEFPKLQVEWERQRYETLRQQVQQGIMPPDLTAAVPDQQEPQPPDDAARTQALTDAVQDAKQFIPGAELLTDADWKVVQQFASFAGDALFRRLTAEEAAAYGMQAGEYVFDGPRYGKIVAQRVEEAKERQRVVDAATKAAAQNARAAAVVTQQQVPPGGGAQAKGTPVPKGTAKPASKQEWERSLDAALRDV